MKVSPIRAAAIPSAVRAKYDLTVTEASDDWPILVVLDHPAADGLDLGFETDVLWLTLEDWTELQRRLRSTSALLDYARRVLEAGLHVPLGHEVERYGAVSAADGAFAADERDSLPFLTPLSAEDQLGADLFHDVINKVWHDDGQIPWRSASEYREIVEFLDVVPPSAQAVVGRWFLRKRRELETGQYRASGLVRLHRRDRLVFGCSNVEKWPPAEFWTAEFAALTTLRHHQAMETGAPTDSCTLGVAALQESRDGVHGVSYFFLLLRGSEVELTLTSVLKRQLEGHYGRYNHTDGTITTDCTITQVRPPPE